MNNRIAAVIVTYNRLEKLKNTLLSYDAQTYNPCSILVVDNNSTDGTHEFLSQWKAVTSNYNKHVITLENNLGGSGGFHEGMKYALKQDFDWLWIADDDAYPDQDAFMNLNSSINSNPGYKAICSSVITDEGIDIAHRKIKSDFILGVSAPIEKYSTDKFDVNIFSFVGSCIERTVIEECGLPYRDFFIWYDDTEYSLRVTEKYKALCVPAIKVFHDTIIEKEWKYSWKTYYGERNRLKTLELHLSKNEFNKYLLRYKLGMIKHFICDYDYYVSQLAGYKDYQLGITGLSNAHLPGSKISKKGKFSWLK